MAMDRLFLQPLTHASLSMKLLSTSQVKGTAGHVLTTGKVPDFIIFLLTQERCHPDQIGLESPTISMLIAFTGYFCEK